MALLQVNLDVVPECYTFSADSVPRLTSVSVRFVCSRVHSSEHNEPTCEPTQPVPRPPLATQCSVQLWPLHVVPCLHSLPPVPAAICEVHQDQEEVSTRAPLTAMYLVAARGPTFASVFVLPAMREVKAWDHFALESPVNICSQELESNVLHK